MTELSLSSNNLQRGAFALLAGTALLLPTGCGLGKTGTDPDVLVSSVSGRAFGGNIPIQGATITLYATDPAATSYGAPGIVLATGTTDANGNFNVQPTVACPGSQQTYITAAGGYQTGQPTLLNTSVLEMAALGKCGVLHNATGINLNELSTVAAGYALSGFLTTTLNTSTGLYVANVGAPSGNNSTTATPTAPAGLAHAFINANNLENWQTGAVNNTFSASYNGTTVTATVPTLEINTIADILQSCVDGATGNANCMTLFSNTPSISNVTPANTLQAVAYLARNPYPSSTANANLFGLVKPGAAYQSKLSAAPGEWSLAVTFGRTGTATGTLPGSYWLALDANDSAYTGLSVITSTSQPLYGIGVYGNSVPTFASFAAGTATRGLATDQLGYLWITNNGSLANRYNLATGALASSFTSTIAGTYSVAVDRKNNLWLGHFVSTATSATNVEQLVDTGVAAGSTPTGTYAVNYTAQLAFAPYGLAIDANQNIWPSGYTDGKSPAGPGTLSYVFPNTGTAAAPAYAPSGTTLIAPVSATLQGSTKPYMVAFDASGNAWTSLTGSGSTSTTGIEEVIPNSTASPTSLAPQTFLPGTTAGDRSNTLNTYSGSMLAIDGAGTLFIPDNSGSNGFHIYTTNKGLILSPTAAIHGCYTSSITADSPCLTGSSSAHYNARQIGIDSTGSVWANDTTAGNPATGMTQFIGLAAPAYPVLAVGQPGVSPGMTTANPLP